MKAKKLLLAVAMALIAVSAKTQTWSIGSPNETDVKATLTGGTLTISGKGDTKDYGWWDSDNLVTVHSPWYNVKEQIIKVIIEDGVTSIGNELFSGCTSLEAITIPERVVTIGDYAFLATAALTSITLPNGLESIGVDAFATSGLTSISIPSGAIGGYAFEECASLTSVTLGSGVTNIGQYAFVSSGITSITIPKSVTTIGDAVFSSCYNLTGIVVETGNSNFAAVNGVLFNLKKTDLLCYPNGKPETSYTAPEGVQNIGTSAFEGGCTNLTSVIFPNSLKTIGNSAFWYNPQLTSIVIPNSVASIGSCAFWYCSGLSSIAIPNSVKEIDNQAFAYCTNLKSITVCWSDPSLVKFPTGTDVFQNLTKSSIKLYVPTGTTSDYQSLSVWNGFDMQEGSEIHDPQLSALTVSCGTLYPTFDPFTTSYIVTVESNVNAITLSAMPVQAISIVSGDGEKTLNPGKNTFDITVKAEAGETQTYTVTVFRLSGEYALDENGYADQTDVESYYVSAFNKTYSFNVIVGRYLYYTLTTFDLSGNVTIHFDFDNGVTCDRTIAVQPNSRYNMTLLLSTDPTDNNNKIVIITPYYYGSPGTPYIEYTPHDYLLTVSEGSNFLRFSPVTVQGKLTAAFVSDVTLDEGYTGINSVENSSLRLFPSPAADFITISGLQGNETLRFYNINGQLVLTHKASGETENVPVSNLSAGIYLLKLDNGQIIKWIKR